MSWGSDRLAKVVLGGTTVAIFMLVWEAIGRTQALGNDVVPPFGATVSALADAAVGSEFWTAVRHTVVQWALGLGLAAAIAIPLGLVLGTGAIRHRSTRSTIDFLRTLPPVMLLPLFVLVWGTGLKMVVLLAVFSAMWPMLIQTISGVRQLEPLTLDTVAVFQIGRWRRFWRVLLPAVSPFVASGVRVAAALSLFVAIVCELIAGSPGLGQVLAEAQLVGDTALMCGIILVTGVIGVLINAFFRLAERRLLSWHPAFAKGN